MNANTLRGFEILAQQMTKEKLNLTWSDATGTHTAQVDHSPLTGTVSIGKIACSKQELPRWLSAFYKATFISLEPIPGRAEKQNQTT